MSYNVDLMIQVRGQIKSDPKSHDQQAWARKTECGTTHCIAGWAAILSGRTFDWSNAAAFCGGLEVFRLEDVDGSDNTAPGEVGRVLLGIDHEESDYLFSGTASQAQALATLDLFIDAGKSGKKVRREDLLAARYGR